MEQVKKLAKEKENASAQETALAKETASGKRKLYYISAEFLIGKLLSNNLINLGLYDEVKKELEAAGKSLAEIEELEPEPSLGNGGLGRLAACFVDSIATLGLNGDGVGLNYHYGLFKQVFDKKHLQQETPNPWMEKESWLTKTGTSYQVPFGGFTVTSRLYDMDVTGYDNHSTRLRLFDLESVDESIVKDGIDFDKTEIEKNLTLFLYPDDSDDKGRLLRVYQQYFMVSNAAQLILDECIARGSNLHDLAEYAAVQINDTHPSMVIPELIRLLGQHGILMNEAISIVSKVCAYTNHTILAEALEKWPISFLEKAVPQLMPIIRELDNRIRATVKDESTYIIQNGLVHMAHMDIHYGYSVNGVAYLHTEILKNTELNNFYKLYPERFNNKTNGITFRRWLMSCNPELSALITSLYRGRLEKRCHGAGKTGRFRVRSGCTEQASGGEDQKESTTGFLFKRDPGAGVKPGFHFRYPGKTPARVQTPADECPLCHPQILRDQSRKDPENTNHRTVWCQSSSRLRYCKGHYPLNFMFAGTYQQRSKGKSTPESFHGGKLQCNPG